MQSEVQNKKLVDNSIGKILEVVELIMKNSPNDYKVIRRVILDALNNLKRELK